MMTNYVFTDRQIASLSHALTNQCDANYEDNQKNIFMSPESVGGREWSHDAHGEHDEGSHCYWLTWHAPMLPVGARFEWKSGTSSAEIAAEKHSNNVWLVTIAQHANDEHESSYFRTIQSIAVAFSFERREWIDDPQWPDTSAEIEWLQCVAEAQHFDDGSDERHDAMVSAADMMSRLGWYGVKYQQIKESLSDLTGRLGTDLVHILNVENVEHNEDDAESSYAYDYSDERRDLHEVSDEELLGTPLLEKIAAAQ